MTLGRTRKRWVAVVTAVTFVAAGCLWFSFYLGSHIVGRRMSVQNDGETQLEVYDTVAGYFVRFSSGRTYYISAIGEKCCVFYTNGHHFLGSYMFDFDDDGEGNFDCPVLGGEWGDWAPDVVFNYEYFEFTDYKGKRHRIQTPS